MVSLPPTWRCALPRCDRCGPWLLRYGLKGAIAPAHLCPGPCERLLCQNRAGFVAAIYASVRSASPFAWKARTFANTEANANLNAGRGSGHARESAGNPGLGSEPAEFSTVRFDEDCEGAPILLVGTARAQGSMTLNTATTLLALVLTLLAAGRVGLGMPSGGRMRVHRRTPLLALCGLLALASCGNPGGATRGLEVRGALVVVDSTAPFTLQTDFPGRLDSTIDEALRYWGGTWAALDGKTITLAGDLHVPCEGVTEASGCYDGAIRVSTRDVATVFDCVEETVLVHEIGHAVIGDPDHTDPRWMDFAAVQSQLEGRPGYDVQGETLLHPLRERLATSAELATRARVAGVDYARREANASSPYWPGRRGTAPQGRTVPTACAPAAGTPQRRAIRPRRPACVRTIGMAMCGRRKRRCAELEMPVG